MMELHIHLDAWWAHWDIIRNTKNVLPSIGYRKLKSTIPPSPLTNDLKLNNKYHVGIDFENVDPIIFNA